MSMKEYGTNKKLEIENIFLGLGSNQGDRELNLKNSIKLLILPELFSASE